MGKETKYIDTRGNMVSKMTVTTLKLDTKEYIAKFESMVEFEYLRVFIYRKSRRIKNYSKEGRKTTKETKG